MKFCLHTFYDILVVGAANFKSYRTIQVRGKMTIRNIFTISLILGCISANASLQETNKLIADYEHTRKKASPPEYTWRKFDHLKSHFEKNKQSQEIQNRRCEFCRSICSADSGDKRCGTQVCRDLCSPCVKKYPSIKRCTQLSKK